MTPGVSRVVHCCGLWYNTDNDEIGKILRRSAMGCNIGRRGFVLGAAGALAVPSAGMTGCGSSCRGAAGYALDPNRRLRITVPGLGGEVRVFWASDTHLGLHDDRDDAYVGNYARMAQWPGSKDGFSAFLDKAKAGNADLVALTGDIISFPTLANVEFAASALENCGVDWIYTAGNHDWHFEGDEGSDAEQRSSWTKKRLMRMYPSGADPLMYSKVVKGVRFVAIDNSIYHITEAQLEFWRHEVAKGDPVVLLMHIPLWVDGFDIDTCGNPAWGAAADKYWQVERRRKWAERQSPETFALRREVLSAPNLVAVFTGHIHRGLTASEQGKFLFTIPYNAKGFYRDVRISG